MDSFVSGFLALYANRGLPGASGFRKDAGEGFYLERELRSIEKKVYEVKYPQLVAREICSKDSTPAGAETYSYAVLDISGEAAIISDFSGDLPSVSVKKTEITGRVVPIGDMFDYSVADVDRASLGNGSLQEEKAKAARRVIEMKIDKMCAIGDTTVGIYGLLNNPNVNILSPVVGSWGASTTAASIQSDIEKLIVSLKNQVNTVFTGQITILIPESKWSYLAKPRSDVSDTTILSMLQISYPEVVFKPWWQCNTAGASGVTRVMGGFFTEETAQLVIPKEFRMEAPQARNLAFQVPCYASCGGAKVRYPVAFVYMDGV